MTPPTAPASDAPSAAHRAAPPPAPSTAPARTLPPPASPLARARAFVAATALVAAAAVPAACGGQPAPSPAPGPTVTTDAITAAARDRTTAGGAATVATHATALRAPSVAAGALGGGSAAATRPPAGPPTATATLPPTLSVTATALWLMVSPRSGGGGGGGGLAPGELPPARYGNAGAPVLAANAAPRLPGTGRPARAFVQERYRSIWDNPFLAAAEAPLSTFAVDVDTAAYSNVRRFLMGDQRPPFDAIRIEELVNYFPYADALPENGGPPVRVNLELTDAPWRPEHRLLRVNLTTRPIAFDARPLSNLVFLIDVSGSMQDVNKLPLVKTALRLLLEQLGENDRVAIVVYAGASGLALPSTSGLDKAAILDAIDRLEAGGSTAGSEGIALAYETALAHAIPGGANRVILATDGDFNVGITDPTALEDLIAAKARSGIFLTVLGFGMGNLQDETLERLADRGNGHYAYIDTPAEARKVFVEQIGGTLVTVAKDVKLQLELNPGRIAGYRLLGYENRLLAAADFNDDTKDAGDIGAGHHVTALYELIPAGLAVPTAPPSPTPAPTLAWDAPFATATAGPDAIPAATPDVDPLRYAGGDAALAVELLAVKLRYKLPDADASTRLVIPLGDAAVPLDAASADLRFASAVAELGMLLRGSPHSGAAGYAAARARAAAALGDDPGGYRAGFLELVDRAAALDAGGR